jgi:exopolyphosphatase/guanosine-5'-triphosphate,3'-diphosphate pyrophosphatase
LHDVGHHIDHANHHRHSYYLITNGELFGFSREELEIMGLVARYHRKGVPKASDAEFRRLPQRARHAVRALSAVLRIADALDRTHARLVRAVRCSVSPKTVDVRIDADGDPELEIWAARRKGDLFEELTDRKLRFAVDQVRDRERETERPRGASVDAAKEPVARAGAPRRGGPSARRAALRVVKA